MLKSGYSPEVIRANIRKEVKAGKPPLTAVAIAYERARNWWYLRHPNKPLPHYLRRSP